MTAHPASDAVRAIIQAAIEVCNETEDTIKRRNGLALCTVPKKNMKALAKALLDAGDVFAKERA